MGAETRLNTDNMVRDVDQLVDMITRYKAKVTEGAGNVASMLTQFNGDAARAHAAGMDRHTTAIDQLQAKLRMLSEQIASGSRQVGAHDADQGATLARASAFAALNLG